MKKSMPLHRFSEFLKITVLFSVALFFFSVQPVFAQPKDDDDKLHVYYTESLGGGDKVYHITEGVKEEAWAPVTCTDENAETFVIQCTQTDKNGNKKILKGQYVKGCLNEDNPPDMLYPEVDTDAFSNNQCPKPEDQGFLYGRLYALVEDASDEANRQNWVSSETLAWWGEGEPKDPDGPKAWKKLYRVTITRDFDVPLDYTGGGVPQEWVGLYTNGAQCNNSNAMQDIGAIPMATSFDSNTAYTCTVLERISGDTGTDLFGKYVSLLYKWAASIVGIVAVLIMVFSGIQISMAGGDTAKIDEAKNRILQSIIGIVLLFLSGLILYTINPGFFTG